MSKELFNNAIIAEQDIVEKWNEYNHLLEKIEVLKGYFTKNISEIRTLQEITGQENIVSENILSAMESIVSKTKDQDADVINEISTLKADNKLLSDCSLALMDQKMRYEQKEYIVNQIILERVKESENMQLLQNEIKLFNTESVLRLNEYVKLKSKLENNNIFVSDFQMFVDAYLSKKFDVCELLAKEKPLLLNIKSGDIENIDTTKKIENERLNHINYKNKLQKLIDGKMFASSDTAERNKIYTNLITQFKYLLIDLREASIAEVEQSIKQFKDEYCDGKPYNGLEQIIDLINVLFTNSCLEPIKNNYTQKYIESDFSNIDNQKLAKYLSIYQKHEECSSPQLKAFVNSSNVTLADIEEVLSLFLVPTTLYCPTDKELVLLNLLLESFLDKLDFKFREQSLILIYLLVRIILQKDFNPKLGQLLGIESKPTIAIEKIQEEKIGLTIDETPTLSYMKTLWQSLPVEDNDKQASLLRNAFTLSYSFISDEIIDEILIQKGYQKVITDEMYTLLKSKENNIPMLVDDRTIDFYVYVPYSNLLQKEHSIIDIDNLDALCIIDSDVLMQQAGYEKVEGGFRYIPDSVKLELETMSEEDKKVLKEFGYTRIS